MPAPSNPEAPPRVATELQGIDALELPVVPHPGGLTRLWQGTWPRLMAAALFLLLWQAVVWSGWRPEYVLPGPALVGARLLRDAASGELFHASATTLARAGAGFAIATVLGVLIGLAVSLQRVVRTAFGSLLTGLQTMPSIAWFPLAILLFQLSEKAILFVVVLGAAPAIANGVVHGVDMTPRLLHRVGNVLGARGLRMLRHIILPAALPSIVSGLKQGWAFAWRSLMAGELLVIIAKRPALGTRLQQARDFSDAEGLLAGMVVILLIGILADSLVFGRLELAVRRRWGLV